jgi:hypothetical protein
MVNIYQIQQKFWRIILMGKELLDYKLQMVFLVLVLSAKKKKIKTEIDTCNVRTRNLRPLPFN